MKKFVLVLVLAAVIATGTAFADYPGGFGIGVQGGWAGGLGGAVTLKLPSLPIFWAVDLDLWPDYLALAVAGDYYLIHNALVPSVNLDWYFGVGGYVGVGLGDPLALWGGVRVPIGLSWQPINILEIYLQVVPRIGLSILPGIGLHSNFFGANLGIRLWF